MKPAARPYNNLKRHVPTNLALGAALIAAATPAFGATFIVVPHGYITACGSPLYWLLTTPLALWAWGAMSFDTWAIRPLTPLLIIAPLLAVALAALSRPSQGDAAALWRLAAVSLLMSALGSFAMRRSPLWPFA